MTAGMTAGMSPGKTRAKVAFIGTGGTIASLGKGPLDLQKARLLLSLALSVTSDPGEITRMFRTY